MQHKIGQIKWNTPLEIDETKGQWKSQAYQNVQTKKWKACLKRLKYTYYHNFKCKLLCKNI